jgi:hypothetical protein
MKYLKETENSLGIKNLQDWGNVTRENLIRLKMPPDWRYYKLFLFFLILSLRDLLDFVQEMYPNLNFKSKSLFYKKTQFLLKSRLHEIFPSEGIKFVVKYYLNCIKRCWRNLNTQTSCLQAERRSNLIFSTQN